MLKSSRNIDGRSATVAEWCDAPSLRAVRKGLSDVLGTPGLPVQLARPAAAAKLARIVVLVCALLVPGAVCIWPHQAQAQTAAGQVRTFTGPSTGEQWRLPSANTEGYASGVAAWLATPSSANLATALTNETGTGAAVFATNPVFGGTPLLPQAAPTAKTVSATLTAAEVLVGIITVNQGAGAASAQQLPLAADMDTALPHAVDGTAFDFSVINISTVAAEDASVTTNTGWTLVGNMDVASNAAATDKSAGRFRARKTGAGAWVLYRLS